jgi:hypothetical protein
MSQGRESIKDRGESIKQPSFLLLNETPRLAYAQYIKDDADRRDQGCRASDADLADPAVGAVVNVVELFGAMRAGGAQADHARIATQGTELCSGSQRNRAQVPDRRAESKFVRRLCPFLL